jgi:arylsulfatase A-like enzyme
MASSDGRRRFGARGPTGKQVEQGVPLHWPAADAVLGSDYRETSARYEERKPSMLLRLIALLFLGALLSAGVGAGRAAAGDRRPNVVFILADDLGWADLEAYGSTFHRTPNLKRLADRSLRFTHYYAASPLCSPTRSSILTGLYPARTGITAPACHLPAVQLEKRLAPGRPNQRALIADSLTRLKGEYTTLAEVFRGAGYMTAHFGKWHLGHGAGYEPRDQGFDLDVPHTPAAAGPGGGYLAPWRFVRDAGFQGEPGEHIDEWMAGQAAKFIREHRDRPFYLNFWLYSVHGPWNARKELIEEFRKSADPKAAQRNPLYAAMVKSMDDAVGRLLDALDAAGITRNTLVVFTSDNGGWAYPPRATDPPGYTEIPATSNAPLRSGKASNYEGGTRVPCLVSWPGKVRPDVRDRLFSSVDWFPTLLSLTDVKRPAGRLDGIDQAPAIRAGTECRDTVYVHFPHGSEAQERNIPGFWPATWVRRGRWKLIRFYARNQDSTDRMELYDLKADVGETRNLAAEQPAKVAELSALMDRFLRDTEAVIPRPNPGFRGGGAD